MEKCFKGDLWVFEGSCKVFSKKFKGCFKEVSKVFHESSMADFSVFQGNFNDV